MYFIDMRVFEVATLITTLLTQSRCVLIEGSLPDPQILSHILDYMRPYLRSLAVEHRNTRRNTNNIFSIIESRVMKLKPLLQDNEVTPTRKEMKGDTTIIEYTPPKIRANKENDKNDKHQEALEKIKSVLKKEAIAKKTSDKITRTIDKMIDAVKASKCYEPGDDAQITFRNSAGNDSAAELMRNITLNQWNELKSIYEGAFQNMTMKLSNHTTQTFLDFHNFFSKLVNDTLEENKKYKISCRLVDLDEHKFRAVRRKIKCEFFKLCSQELGEFFKDFYTTLNDTSVSVCKNYAAMYVRDVNLMNKKDKDHVLQTMDSLAATIEKKVDKIFVKQLSEFVVDKDKLEYNNIRLIKDFIRNVINKVLSRAENELDEEISQLRITLKHAVEKDMKANLDVDLGNLKRDYLLKICQSFSTCNGKDNIGSRRSNTNSVKPVHLEFDVYMDEELKKTISAVNKYFVKRASGYFDNSNLKYLDVTRTARTEAIPTQTDDNTKTTVAKRFISVQNVLESDTSY